MSEIKIREMRKGLRGNARALEDKTNFGTGTSDTGRSQLIDTVKLHFRCANIS